MEVTSAREYKSRQTKVVELPSGARFRIRKIPPKTLGKLFSMLGVSPGRPQQLQDAFFNRISEVIDLLFPVCIVEPSVKVKPDNPDTLAVDDIEPNDAFFLITELFNFSGLTGEAAEERRNFRKE